MGKRKNVIRSLFMGLGTLALAGGSGVGLYFAVKKIQDIDSYEHVYALPTQSIETTTLSPDFLNRGVQRSTINRHHVFKDSDWKTNQEHIVMIGNNPNPNPISNEEKGKNNYLDPGEKIHVDYLETEMFRYAVDMNSYFGYNRLTHHDIEEIVKVFEENVNYGAGAHIFAINGSLEYINKPVIEFLQSDHIISWGGAAGAEVSFPREKAQQVNQSYEDQVSQMASLALHEYGHHETIISASIFEDTSSTSHTFDGFYNELMKTPYLRPFGRYWRGTDDPDGTDYITNIDYHTVFGKLHARHPYFGPASYSMSSNEFITRYEMFMESGVTSRIIRRSASKRYIGGSSGGSGWLGTGGYTGPRPVGVGTSSGSGTSTGTGTSTSGSSTGTGSGGSTSGTSAPSAPSVRPAPTGQTVTSGITKAQILHNIQWSADIASFYHLFNDHDASGVATVQRNPFSSHPNPIASDFVRLYKDKVYGYNHQSSIGMLAHVVKPHGDQEYDRIDVSISPNKNYTYTWLNGANGTRKRTKDSTVNAIRALGLNADSSILNTSASAAVSLTGTDLRIDRSDFRYNTNYDDDRIEETQQGYLYSINEPTVDARKKAINTLLTSELKTVFNYTIKYYKNNVLIKTKTG